MRPNLTQPERSQGIIMAMTMLQMAGARPTPATMADGLLLIIDAQREYTDGLMPLTGVQPAIRFDRYWRSPHAAARSRRPRFLRPPPKEPPTPGSSRPRRKATPPRS